MVNLPDSFKTTKDKELLPLQESIGGKKRNLNVADEDPNKKKDVRNNDQNPDFKMLPGKDWKKFFCRRCLQELSGMTEATCAPDGTQKACASQTDTTSQVM